MFLIGDHKQIIPFIISVEATNKGLGVNLKEKDLRLNVAISRFIRVNYYWRYIHINQVWQYRVV
jgi:hypothetical protein